MLDSKKFEKIIVFLIIAALMFSVAAMCFPNLFAAVSNDASNSQSEYASVIFGKDIINVEITADENDWNEMLENKNSKPYIPCDLTIDGQKFSEVGIRPKGNSSLTNISGNRISFRLDFDHYIDNQKCYGLEQMALNNLQADATYMKDYVAYDLMAYEGVNAPLHTFAFITLNGEPFGVYLAVEIYDEDYLERVYGDTNIQLYNVKSSGLDTFEAALINSETGDVVESSGDVAVSGMGGPGGGGGMPPDGGMPPGGGMPQGNMQKNNAPNGGESRDMNPGAPPEGNNSFGEMAQPPGGGGGGDLVYTDDNTASYSNIFANAVSDTADAEDFAKVIKAIKYLNKDGVTTEELETYWDVDAALRYLAVHAFMVNGDSYTGSMQQNYFLAEQNGRITVLPWDYNLSFGAFGGGHGGAGGGSENSNTTEAINHAIDTPLFSVSMDARPLVSVLLGVDEYKERYHKYLDELTQYASGDFIDKLEIVENAIYPYIESETVSFYSPEEQRNAFSVMKEFLRLRCMSIQAQLNGIIPSVTEQQIGANLITADFSVSEMGSMGGGGPQGGGAPPDGGPQGGGAPPDGGMPQGGGPQGGGDMRPPNAANESMGANGGNYATFIIAMAVFCLAFVCVKLFERNY